MARSPISMDELLLRSPVAGVITDASNAAFASFSAVTAASTSD